MAAAPPLFQRGLESSGELLDAEHPTTRLFRGKLALCRYMLGDYRR